MRYENHYSLDKKGKVRIFKCRVSHEVGCSHIITETGLLGGKMVVRDKPVKFGRQGRTVEQQALMMAASDVSKKKDEGYKCYDKLARRHLSPDTFVDLDPETNDNVRKVFKGITWNTSSYWTPLPMLAKPYKDENLSKGYIAQPKLDGVRDLSINNPIRLCSRGGKFYTGLSHIERELKIIFNRFPDMYLDGELYTHGVTQNEISGAARKQKRDMFTDYTWLEYHVYDIPITKGSEAIQGVREGARTGLKAILGDELKYIKFIPSHIVHTYEEAKRLHDLYVSQGYEGLILRDPHAPYMFSFRDKCLLKMKVFIEEPFICKGYSMQTDDISTFTLTFTNEEGTAFKARAKGSHALWQRYLNDPPLGREMTIRYINRSDVNNVPEKATVLPLADYDKWD